MKRYVAILVVTFNLLLMYGAPTFSLDKVEQPSHVDVNKLLEHPSWRDKSTFPPSLTSPTIDQVLFPEVSTVSLVERVTRLSNCARLITNDYYNHENAPVLLLLLTKEIASLLTYPVNDFNSPKVQETLYQLYALTAPAIVNSLIVDFISLYQSAEDASGMFGIDSFSIYFGQHVARIMGIPYNIFMDKDPIHLSGIETERFKGFFAYLVLMFDAASSHSPSDYKKEDYWKPLHEKFMHDNPLLRQNPSTLSDASYPPESPREFYKNVVLQNGAFDHFGNDYIKKTRNMRMARAVQTREPFNPMQPLNIIDHTHQNSCYLTDLFFIHAGGKEKDRVAFYNLLLETLRNGAFQSVRNVSERHYFPTRASLHQTMSKYATYATLPRGIVRRSPERYITEQAAKQQPCNLLFFCGNEPTYGYYLDADKDGNKDYHRHDGWFTLNIDVSVDPSIAASFGDYKSDQANYDYLSKYVDSFDMIYEEGYSLPREMPIYDLTHKILKNGGAYIFHQQGSESDLKRAGYSRIQYIPQASMELREQAIEDFKQSISPSLFANLPHHLIHSKWFGGFTIAFK